MRLVCPNCDAQYEVDDGLIPPEGRDVQCSNCTTTWFQPAAGATAPPTDGGSESGPGAAQETDAPDADDAETRAAAAAIAGAGREPRKPQVDPEAMSVIHEEVARETRARAAEQGGLETQPDLGLDDGEAEARANAARDRMARRRGIPTHSEIEDEGSVEADEASDPRVDANTKGELLPDIEEINSTLADAPDPVPEQEMGAGAADAKTSGRRGFRIGFGLMLLVFAALIFLYVYAPDLAKRFPGAASALESYRAFADSVRVWLDGTAQALVEQINMVISRISGDGA